MKRFHLILLAVLSGVLLSLPWLEILPGWILFVAFIPLLIIEEYIFRKKNQVANIVFFAYAFLSFLVWNALTTWWTMHATLFGMFLIVILNALLMATVWWLFHRVKRYSTSGFGNFSLVVFWLAFEYLHYHWDIEWPWLSLGNGFSNQVKMIQWYEYTGVLGGSFWVLIANLLLFQFLINAFLKFRIKSGFYLALFILVILVPSSLSFRQYNRYNETGEDYEIIILQPNVDPYTEKFKEMGEVRQMRSLLLLADSLITDSTDYVVGPETVLHPLWETDRLIEDLQIVPFYSRAVACPKLNFVLGATTQLLFQPTDSLPETVRKFPDKELYFDVYNSALQINNKQEVQIYHKSILVSGVEKMPFSKYFSFIEKYILDLGGTTGSLGTQAEPTNFTGTSGLKVAPVICYESVFGEYVSKYVQKGAALIFIITNDGWWKDTPGYRQHLSFSRLRAIETRRSIARSANTGISAFINQRGDILQATGWWSKTAIQGSLKANERITFYVRYGDFIGRVCLFVSVMLLLYFFIQKKIK